MKMKKEIRKGEWQTSQIKDNRTDTYRQRISLRTGYDNNYNMI